MIKVNGDRSECLNTVLPICCPDDISKNACVLLSVVLMAFPKMFVFFYLLMPLASCGCQGPIPIKLLDWIHPSAPPIVVFFRIGCSPLYSAMDARCHRPFCPWPLPPSSSFSFFFYPYWNISPQHMPSPLVAVSCCFFHILPI